MALAYEQSRKTYLTGNGSLAFSGNVKAGSLIVVGIASSDENDVHLNDTTVTATNCGSFTKADNHISYNLVLYPCMLECWYAFATAAAACTVSLTVSAGNTSISLFIHEFSGITPTSSIDVQDQNTGTGQSPSGGPVTTTVADTLLFGVMGDGDGGANDISKDADYTEMQEYNDGGSANAMHSQYRIVSSTLTDTANWTLASSTNWAGWVVAFKMAAAAGGDMTANISGSGSLTGSLKGTGGLSGSISGGSSLAAPVKGIGKLTGVVEAESALEGVLKGIGKLVGLSEADSSLIGTLKGDGKLAGTIEGSSFLTGTFELPSGSMTASIAGAAELIAVLKASGKLASAIATDSTLDASLKGIGELLASLTPSSTALATLKGGGKLAAAIEGKAVLYGVFEGYVPPVSEANYVSMGLTSHAGVRYLTKRHVKKIGG